MHDHEPTTLYVSVLWVNIVIPLFCTAWLFSIGILLLLSFTPQSVFVLVRWPYPFIFRIISWPIFLSHSCFWSDFTKMPHFTFALKSVIFSFPTIFFNPIFVFWAFRLILTPIAPYPQWFWLVSRPIVLLFILIRMKLRFSFWCLEFMGQLQEYAGFNFA